jgi:transcriptional regulator with XRE-family HTH domain
MDPLKDAEEFGRRVSAARGYAQLKKTEFAQLMGSSVPTVTRWEAGERGSIGATIGEREQLAERIRRETNCPAGIFSEPAAEDPVASFEAALRDVRAEQLEQAAKLLRIERLLEAQRKPQPLSARQRRVEG